MTPRSWSVKRSTGSVGAWQHHRRDPSRRRAGRLLAAATAGILPRGIAELPCGGRSAGAILSEPSAPGRWRVGPRNAVPGSGSDVPRCPKPAFERLRRHRVSVRRVLVRATRQSPPNRIHLDHMDAKQVWRAALGELQVSLSPANFETWLRDTQLVDVDDQRFRIAVPNGFAKDWLETRYRSLISQTLARIVGYSVQVEFAVQGTDGVRGPAGRDERLGRWRGAPAGARPSGSSRPASEARAGRPTSTRATRSRTSSSARRTVSPTPRACRSRSVRATPTTRCSCTAASVSARPT